MMYSIPKRYNEGKKGERKIEDGYIPILDTKMRMHEGGIIHKFYAKPMTSREVIWARSSIPTTNKIKN